MTTFAEMRCMRWSDDNRRLYMSATKSCAASLTRFVVRETVTAYAPCVHRARVITFHRRPSIRPFHSLSVRPVLYNRRICYTNATEHACDLGPFTDSAVRARSIFATAFRPSVCPSHSPLIMSKLHT